MQTKNFCLYARLFQEQDLRAAKFYLTKNVCVKASVKSQVTLLWISLKSQS